MKLSGVCIYFVFLSEYAKKVTVKSVRTGSRSFFFFHSLTKKKQTPRKASFYAFLTRKINTVVFIEER